MRDCIQRARITNDDDVASESCVAFRFPASEPVFAGHFPGSPVLPGFFMIEMTRMAAEWLRGERLTIVEVTKARFQRSIQPDEGIDLRLKIETTSVGLRTDGHLSVGEEQAADIRLILSPAEDKNG